MPFKKIIDTVPEFYHQFLPQVFYMEIPPEPFSNCFNCPMIAKSREELNNDLAKPFSPDTKCCTFIPRLPNFMAGAILSDNDPAMEEGKKRIADRIRSGEGIFPNGVYPADNYNRLYLAKSSTEFGRSKLLQCPYFVEGIFNCSIWKYREAICALWFCKHLAGKKGKEFWDSVIDYLKYVQESLMNIAARECGLNPVDPYGEGTYPEFRESITNGNKGRNNTDVWKEWEGSEVEYYIRCYEIVANLDQGDIQNIIERGEALAKKIENSAAVVIDIPEFLVVNKNLIQDDQNGNYIIEISNYIEVLQKSIVWSFRLPKSILDLFDGRMTTSGIRQKFLELNGVKIEPEILIALYRHGILQDLSI